MKFFKILLCFLLTLVLMSMGVLFFSDKIIYVMTKDKNTKFENVKFLVREGKIEFSNFYLEGIDLGKGDAKIEINGTGPFRLIPKVNLYSMKLEKKDTGSYFSFKNTLIDNYIKGLENENIITELEKKDTTEKFINQLEKDIKNIKLNIDYFVNIEKKSNIEELNNLKKFYFEEKDIKERIKKLKEIRTIIQPLLKDILDKREKIEKINNDMVEKSNILLDNLILDMEELENKVQINDFDKLDKYIFLDNGKKLIDFQNKFLKIMYLTNSMKKLKFNIMDFNINNGKIIVDMSQKNKVKLILENKILAEVISKENADILNYKYDNVKSLINYSNNGIESTISYLKNDLLENKNIEIVGNYKLDFNKFTRENKTLMDLEEKKHLLEKLKEIENKKYYNLMENYNNNIEKVEILLKNILDINKTFDDFKYNVLSLNKSINIDELSREDIKKLKEVEKIEEKNEKIIEIEDKNKEKVKVFFDKILDKK